MKKKAKVIYCYKPLKRRIIELTPVDIKYIQQLLAP